MPIVFKGLTGPELIDLLEVPDDMKWWLGISGLKVTVYATEIRFAGQDITAAIPCKMEHLVLLKAGTLGELAKKALRMSVVGAIKQLKKKLDIADAPKAPPSAPDAKEAVIPPFSFASPGSPAVTAPGGVMATLAKNKTKPPFPGPATAWSDFPAAQITTAPTVPLGEATQMYQPVKGSSGSSRYFLVGGNDELRIACRYQGNTLSVRIEGPGYHKNKPRLVACGFTGVNAEYASMHLQVDDAVTAAKALGAILLGLGVKLDTPLPALSPLHNKGQ